MRANPGRPWDTNRRRAAAGERYAALLEAQGSVMWELALPAWKYKLVSGQAERILGFPAQQWLDDPEFWPNHLHPQDRAAAVESRRMAASQGGGDYQFEYRMIAATGRVVWLRDVVSVKTTSGR